MKKILVTEAKWTVRTSLLRNWKWGKFRKRTKNHIEKIKK